MASNGTHSVDTEWSMSVHTTLTILACLIVAVNLPVVIIYCKISTLRHSAGNTFLVGLAVADILCACLAIPTGIMCELRVLKLKEHKHNVCVFYWASGLILSLGSVYHILAATVAKYIAIVHPMRNITACTKPRVRYVIACIWILSFLSGHIPFYLSHIKKEEEKEFFDNYGIFMLVFAFAVPAFVLTCIHVHIYFRLFLLSRPGTLIVEANTRSENNGRVAALFFLLFLVFVISWLPWYLLWADLIEPNSGVEDALTVLRFLAPVVHPMMFTFIKRDFRKAAASLMSRLHGRQRRFSSRRSYHTQATSSVDRANFIEQRDGGKISQVEPQREETTVNEPEDEQIV